MGEENEALRNLLSDTGRKIGELDELKDAFRQDRRAIQQHAARAGTGKIAGASLTGMLDESRTAYETLRTEFYPIEKKAIAPGTEAEKLRE